MTATARGLSAGTVCVLLDYVCPLTGAVPPHLLSRPLLQRHHFLALSPEKPAEYLAWPSAQQSRAVHLLQSVPVPPPDSSISVNYSAHSAGDNLFAHARITPDLRLVFLWDNHAGWLYHNVALMPFPPDSYPSFERAYAVYAPEDFLPEPGYTLNVTHDDDDSYWDAYAGSDHDDRAPASTNALDPNPNSEDAYWAQYSAVQGSGDSTLPSPRPGRNAKHQDGLHNKSSERIIIPSDDLQMYREEPYNPLQPPEPSALASRLAALAMQSRSGAASPPLIDDSPTSDTDSNTASAPGVIETTTSAPAASSQVSIQSQNNADEFCVVDSSPTAELVDPTQEILQEHIKSLYRLWKLGRSDRLATQEKVVFLATVKRALEQL
ncbi:hypothetical protein BDN70DRAFT_876371 [Pholiota conissans]|uniref:Uncharacterized protein n=1 Tax=Pholiota conissans TaxID=109636 RepID=A0A9P6D389_9AGAR|nr:hypothetical protein BDN70DRAFT_876371 [Pholiota conissans]